MLRLLFYRVVFGCAVGAEDSPISYTQSAQDGLSLLSTKLRIGIHRGHKNRRVLIVLGLLRSKAVGVDIDISREGNVIVIVDEYHFSGKMAALTFVYLKMQITEIEEADLC